MTCAYGGTAPLVADTYVSPANPNTNFGLSPVMNIGNGNFGMVQFDVSKVQSQLFDMFPNTAFPVIGRAMLTVYVNHASVAGTLYATAAAAAWAEGTVTYGSKPDVGGNFLGELRSARQVLFRSI